MAYIPEKMDENKISFLANEIARTYMAGKMSSDVESYIDIYMQVYKTAKKRIAEREQDRIDSITPDEIASAFDEELPKSILR